MPEISAKMTLDTSMYINAIKQSIQYTDNFRKTVEEAKQSINLISMTKVQVKIEVNINKTLENIAETKKQLDGIKKNVRSQILIEAPINTIAETKKQLNEIKKNIQIMIAAKDSASNSIKNIGKEVKSLVSRPFQVVFKAKDEVSKVIKSITDKVNSLKDLADKIGKNTIGAAAESEQEEVVMKHVIGNNNQMSSSQDIQKMTNDYISQLKSQINAAPFLPSEFMSAGRKALNITNGNTKEGMDLVKLSENMAALNPGKSLMDAMNALSDLKKGETKSMDGFGVNISQNDISKSGGIDNYFKTQINDKGSLGKAFAGGASELSKITAGQWKKIEANLKTIGINFGKVFLPIINKVLTPLATLLSKNTDKFTKFAEDIVKAGSKIKIYLIPVFNFLSNLGKEYVIPAMSSIFNVIKKYVPPIIKIFTEFIDRVKPHLEIFWIIIKENIIPIIKDLWGKVQDIMPGVQSLIESAFKVGAKAIGVAVDIFGNVAPVVKDMYDIISPILDGVISIFNHVADAIKTAVDWLDSWNGKEVKDNTPKLNNTPGQYDLITGKKNQNYNFYTGNNALGTNYWRGGLTWINEAGPELVELPGGTRIHSNRESMNMIKPKNEQVSNINFTTGIKNQTKSISQQAGEWGKDMPNNLAKGIRNNTKSVTDAVTFMATKIRELIHFSVPDKGPLSDFDTYSVDMLKNFGTGIKNNTKLVIDPTTNMSTNVKTVYSQLSTESNSYGKQVIQELGAGIQASSNNLISIVKTLTDKVIQQFKTGFGIHSPSKVMFDMGGFLMQGLVNGMSSKDVSGFIENWIGSITSSAGGAISGNLKMWIATAMALTGAPSDWFGPLSEIIEHESGGNPMDINLWDYNAQHGDPSRGLMQLTGENMADYHLPGMTNIYDPVSNIAAGIQYIKSRYGTVYNVPGIRALAEGRSYVGYSNGGIADRASIFGEGQYAEAAIPLKKNSSHSQQLLDIADSYINGDKKETDKKDVKIIINFNGLTVGEEEFFDRAGEHIVKKVRLALNNM
ncbi:transglycosylase SLT domain-containing protein [Clostridium scatologenes]|uniref:Phage tail tape measure protein n=1 Tax=Clostridium scatologenes TaxID=1548 RepID=A0A0E3JP02_CLOSL|nr:transglycosylase SLT domain-containing protein [Clostridium scatologenes]AKA69835.1 phage tail tape measure protein [Clostridium scatologenes]